MAIRFYPISIHIRGILLIIRDTATASCSTTTELRKTKTSSMKGSGKRDSSTERHIKLNPIFSIWGISRPVSKLGSVKSRPKPLFIREKLGKASSKAKGMKFLKMGTSTMVSSSKTCSTALASINGKAVHISTAIL